jgi:cytochrome c biogenesis protein CcdA
MRNRRHVEVAGATGSARTLLTVAAVTLVAVAGYGGFRVAAGLDLAAETGIGLVVLAVITGFAVFFSPCSFPLLVAMLAGTDRAAATGRHRRDSLGVALAIGAGASIFLLTVGAVVGLLGEGVVRSIGFSTTPGRLLRGAVAVTIIAAGLTQLGVLRLPLWRIARFAQPIDRQRTKVAPTDRQAANVLYGFGFVIAGFG